MSRTFTVEAQPEVSSPGLRLRPRALRPAAAVIPGRGPAHRRVARLMSGSLFPSTSDREPSTADRSAR